LQAQSKGQPAHVLVLSKKRPCKDIPDAELIARYQSAKDEAYFEELFARYRYKDKVSPMLRSASPAAWYLALAYLQKNEVAEAKSVLGQIIADDGAYKEKATKLVERLGQ